MSVRAPIKNTRRKKKNITLCTSIAWEDEREENRDRPLLVVLLLHGSGVKIIREFASLFWRFFPSFPQGFFCNFSRIFNSQFSSSIFFLISYRWEGRRCVCVCVSNSV